MKIGILTQPLKQNYGGLLQAFALQYFLKKQGNDVYTIDFDYNKTLKRVIKDVVKKIIKHPVYTTKQININSQNTARFIAEHIKTTQKITSAKEINYIQKYHFDAYIVGSDQVWRPVYSPNIATFFLDFLQNNDKVKKIAYAASFGVDNLCEFTAEQISYFSSLLSKFDLITVREDSAVDLCQQSFNCEAKHVLDPTLLLTKEDYLKLVDADKHNLTENKGKIMAYVLDKSEDKQKILSAIEKTLGYESYKIMPTKKQPIYPAVTQWLSGFRDAKYVVTDSFHGVAFSIIFNKPFIAIGNKSRGLARFTSILKLFELESRLIFNSNDLSENLINTNIDFDLVNSKLRANQLVSEDLLLNALKRE